MPPLLPLFEEVLEVSKRLSDVKRASSCACEAWRSVNAEASTPACMVPSPLSCVSSFFAAQCSSALAWYATTVLRTLRARGRVGSRGCMRRISVHCPPVASSVSWKMLRAPCSQLDKLNGMLDEIIEACRPGSVPLSSPDIIS